VSRLGWVIAMCALAIAAGPTGLAANARAVGAPTGPVLASVLADRKAAAVDWLAARQDAVPAGPGRGLVPSFDAAGGPGASRAWIYDGALAALAFTEDGRLERARAVLSRLAALQRPDGALAFSYPLSADGEPEPRIRSGAMAWVGTAAIEYERASGDRSLRPLAAGIARDLLDRQAPSGSVRGGYGRLTRDGSFVAERLQWASTEHNVDAYFFLRDLGYLTGSRRYLAAARRVRTSLLTRHWNADEGRFDQGIGDRGRALDLVTWGGLFLLAVGEREMARRQIGHLRAFRVRRAPIAPTGGRVAIDGYRPYLRSPGYRSPPRLVWAEGTWGAILLKRRLGEPALRDIGAMLELRDATPGGGYLQASAPRPEVPYELRAWPAAAPAAWAAIVLGDSSILWRPDGWPVTAP